MKYISNLSNEQIKEIMEIYAPNHSELNYQLEESGLRISLLDNVGCEDNYILKDYTVEIIDWMGNEHNYLIEFRKKMLFWFGEQYAIDYLLS